tara:strand:- start:15134 stop:15580 length:447 start_codon:yes stop_codon:yes gene_type:complete
MAIKIEGTQRKKSGGGGLGSLLGKIAGGIAGLALAPVTGGASLAAAATGMGIGGTVGGLAGGAIKPGSQTDLAIPISGAKDSGMAGPAAPKTSAIDRLNSAIDLGTSVYGGLDSINNLTAPKVPTASSGLMTQNTTFPDKYARRMGRV